MFELPHHVATAFALASALAVAACAGPAPGSSPAPTPTTAPKVLESSPAAASLEQEVISVCRHADASVVNVTVTVMPSGFTLMPVPQQGTGSGFVYDTEGHIVTNFHVVQDSTDVTVTLPDETALPASVVGVDPSNDLAVLHIDAPAEQLRPVSMGRSDGLQVGQFVVAVGNPFGLERTATMGIISSLGRVIQSPDGSFIGEIIQTDAAINPGNSGGPLLDRAGRLIGVNAAIFSPSHSSAGIGFAIPVDTVERVVPELIAHGRYPHPWLGVATLGLNPSRAQLLRQAGIDVPVSRGALVLEVAPGSPAAEAGIRGGRQQVRIGPVVMPIGGDVLTALNGKNLTSARDFATTLENTTRVGQTVTVTYNRDGAEHTVKVEVAERPEQDERGL